MIRQPRSIVASYIRDILKVSCRALLRRPPLELISNTLKPGRGSHALPGNRAFTWVKAECPVLALSRQDIARSGVRFRGDCVAKVGGMRRVRNNRIKEGRWLNQSCAAR